MGDLQHQHRRFGKGGVEVDPMELVCRSGLEHRGADFEDAAVAEFPDPFFECYEADFLVEVPVVVTVLVEMEGGTGRGDLGELNGYRLPTVEGDRAGENHRVVERTSEVVGGEVLMVKTGDLLHRANTVHVVRSVFDHQLHVVEI